MGFLVQQWDHLHFPIRVPLLLLLVLPYFTTEFTGHGFGWDGCVTMGPPTLTHQGSIAALLLLLIVVPGRPHLLLLLLLLLTHIWLVEGLHQQAILLAARVWHPECRLIEPVTLCYGQITDALILAGRFILRD